MFLREQTGRGVTLTTHLHLELCLKMMRLSCHSPQVFMACYCTGALRPDGPGCGSSEQLASGEVGASCCSSLGPSTVMRVAPAGAVIRMAITTTISTVLAYISSCNKWSFLAVSRATGPMAACALYHTLAN